VGSSIRAAVATAALSAGLMAATGSAAAEPLIHGRVAAPGGGAAQNGTATVFLDTTDGSANHGTLHSVATAPITSGAFSVVARPAGSVARVVRRSDGWANFLLMVRTPDGQQLYPFSRRFASGGSVVASSAADNGARIELSAYRPGEGPSALTASQAPHRADCEWKRSGTYYRYTRVGQLHQWDGFDSTFEYATGGSADTNIGGAVDNGSGFTATGASFHISKSTQQQKGQIFRPNKRRFSRYVTTRFAYYYFYLKGKDCTKHQRILRPGWHVGGSYYHQYNDAAEVLDGHCNQAKGQQRLIVAAKSTEWTSGGTAGSVGAGVSLLGVTLGTQSGWSNNVKTSWTNRGNKNRAICSVTGDPNTAPVTYVGGAVNG
jgi:hypothetical protein